MQKSLPQPKLLNSWHRKGYFSSLGEGEKTILRNCGITTKFSETLFNYARFLKTLNPTELELKVKKWIKIRGFDVPTIQPIIILLVKAIISNGTTLQQFSLYGSFIDPEILHSLHQAGLYLSRLQALHLDLTTEVTTSDYHWDKHDEPNILCYLVALGEFEEKGIISNEFLKFFINTLRQLSFRFRSEYEPQVYDDLARIINLQKQLERFWISGYRRSNINLSEILNNNISNLDIIHSPQIAAEDLRLVLRKYGKYIQKLKIYAGELLKNLVSLEEIGEFCPNITRLDIKKAEFSKQLINLISNLQKLQVLLLWCNTVNIPEEELKERVIKFAEILPLTLQCLQLDGWLQPYLDILLDHCREPLKTLLTEE
ncbi:hypothetical protein F8M41_006936 [Gigaspora margarita]|uniref:Uncharacterized protein n=1 Tax=Gigaspora margarita TaxID=4874 RepID=A0A8H4AWL1_GIGMA|nr:hypothetical protein F8M41_006936 [Gigaspora margarita]